MPYIRGTWMFVLSLGIFLCTLFASEPSLPLLIFVFYYNVQFFHWKHVYQCCDLIYERSQMSSFFQRLWIPHKYQIKMVNINCLVQAVEDTGEKPGKVLDEDKVNEELKQLREALEQKSKELAEKTEGAVL